MADVVEKLEDYDPDRAANTPLAGAAAEEHMRLARQTGIFGDTDTTAGVNASGTDVPSADNEAATVAVAAKDAAAEDGDGDADDAGDAQARRQVDASAGTTGFADEVDAGAAEQGDATTDVPDKAADKVDAIKTADSHAEVDRLAADDDRVTVKDAAEARREELNS